MNSGHTEINSYSGLSEYASYDDELRFSECAVFPQRKKKNADESHRRSLKIRHSRCKNHTGSIYYPKPPYCPLFSSLLPEQLNSASCRPGSPRSKTGGHCLVTGESLNLQNVCRCDKRVSSTPASIRGWLELSRRCCCERQLQPLQPHRLRPATTPPDCP